MLNLMVFYKSNELHVYLALNYLWESTTIHWDTVMSSSPCETPIRVQMQFKRYILILIY